jgi:hypothetical protein
MNQYIKDLPRVLFAPTYSVFDLAIILFLYSILISDDYSVWVAIATSPLILLSAILKEYGK